MFYYAVRRVFKRQSYGSCPSWVGIASINVTQKIKCTPETIFSEVFVHDKKPRNGG